MSEILEHVTPRILDALCTICGNAFRSSKHSPRHCQRRYCRAEYSRRLKDAKAEELSTGLRMCKQCETKQPLENFWRSHGHAYEHTCKQCRRGGVYVKRKERESLFPKHKCEDCNRQIRRWRRCKTCRATQRSQQEKQAVVTLGAQSRSPDRCPLPTRSGMCGQRRDYIANRLGVMVWDCPEHGYAEAPVKRPPNFVRYDQRQAWEEELGQWLQTATGPVDPAASARNSGRRTKSILVGKPTREQAA